VYARNFNQDPYVLPEGENFALSPIAPTWLRVLPVCPVPDNPMDKFCRLLFGETNLLRNTLIEIA
jgi:hypothetical protein